MSEMTDLFDRNSPVNSAGPPGSTSKLRTRINILRLGEREREREKLETTTLQLYNNFLRLRSDEFDDLDLDLEPPNQRKLANNEEFPEPKIVKTVLDEYHNHWKEVDSICEKYKYDPFHVVASLCQYALGKCPQVKGLTGYLDLSRVIQHMDIDEYSVILLIDIIVARSHVTMKDVICELNFLPSHAILALTLILVELRFPQMALVFEDTLSQPSPEINGEEFEEQQRLYSEAIDEFLTSQAMPTTSDNDLTKQISEMMNEVTLTINERPEFLDDMLESLKGLTEMISKKPTLEMETYLSDDYDSDVPQTNEKEQEMCIMMRKVNAKWLENELTHERLCEATQIRAGEFYFVRLSKLQPPQKSGFDSGNSQHYSAIFMDGFTMCKLIEESGPDSFVVKCLGLTEFQRTNQVYAVQRRDLAMGCAPSDFRCPEGTRVVVQCRRCAKQIGREMRVEFFSGTIAVKPLIQNRLEYFVFLDNNTDAYIDPKDIRLMVEQPIDPNTGRFQPRLAYNLITHNPTKAQFIRRYLSKYPDWPLITLKKSENTQRILAVRNGIKESAFVLDVDRQLSLLRFPINKPGRDCAVMGCKEHEHVDEWVYRGNPERFPNLPQADQFQIPGSSVQATTINYSERRLARKSHHTQFEMSWQPYSLNNTSAMLEAAFQKRTQTARKSSKQPRYEVLTPFAGRRTRDQDSEAIEKRRRLSGKVKFVHLPVPDWPTLLSGHLPRGGHPVCSATCVRPLQKFQIQDEEQYRIRSPYFTPLLNGWTRLLYIMKPLNDLARSKARVLYRTPCGKTYYEKRHIARYLQTTQQPDISIDMFSFDPELRPHILATAPSPDVVKLKDFSRDAEDVPIPVVNALDNTPIPTMLYRARRQPNHADAANIEATISLDFCAGCDCEDDCSDPTKCACQQRTIQENSRLNPSIGVSPKLVSYKFRTLETRHSSGVYECYHHCNCSKTRCFNRVVQNNLKVPLQLFMTAEIGWGVRTLVDLPRGSFICTYAGELLTNKLADKEGTEHPAGDMYLAELDLIEQVEMEKENQGIDFIQDEGIFSDYESESKDVSPSRQPTLPIGQDQPRTSPPKQEVKSAMDDEMELNEVQDQILRAMDGAVDAPQPVVKDRSREEVRAARREVKQRKFDILDHFDPEYQLFIVNAGHSGNIGRFLNHSCDPNVIIQQVLVDTHDLRLPWLAFFTDRPVKAGEELCWNYSYIPNSIPGKRIDCKCRAENCTGRLL